MKTALCAIVAAGGVLMSVVGIAGGTAAADLELAIGGRTDYVIVVARDASPSERHGAQELARFLKEMSGADFRVLQEGGRVLEKAILVGRGPTVESLVGAAEFRGLGDDGFLIRVCGQRLILAGGRQRGSMYACYSLLEDILGCRWYTSTVSVIPKKPTIRIPAGLSVREVPSFENRDPFYFDAFDADWAARNRSTANHSRLDETRGGKIAYFPFVHSFEMLVPPGEYYDKHPEYFSLVDGKRLKEHSQLCLTNPDVLRIATERVLQWMEAHPEAKIFSVSQNDWGNPCQCESCQAVVRREGSESGPLLEFVNAIARETRKRFPDRLIDTLAYQYTKEPPRTVRPEPNVRVRLCPIEACVAHPFEQCQRNAVFVDVLKRWTDITDNLYVWHYVVNFRCYQQPVPNLRELAADIPMYARHGVKGLFLQGMYQEGGNGELCELRSWVMAKMLWNANRDTNVLVDDFLNGYYGPAAPAMRRYIDLMHDNVEKNSIHVGIYDPPTAPYLTKEVLSAAEGCFDEAEAAVRFRPEYLRRVQRDRLAIRYVRLMQDIERWRESGRETKAAGDLWARLQQFAADLESHGAKRISEPQTIREWLEGLRRELGQ
jgi:hypothetical protein